MTGLIAHEWIEARGGSENVLEAIAELYPDADLVAPWNNAPERFPDRTVRELWLSRSPLRNRKSLSVAALTVAWRQALPRAANYDWILASSHMFSHHIKPRGQSASVPKLVYCYTPARYVWTPELDSRGNGLLARTASAWLRPLDRKRAHEATAVAGISKFVAARIETYWGVEAQVIYPPVESTAIQAVSDWRANLSGHELSILATLPSQFVLGASRFIAYKRLDLVIQAGEAAGLPVVVAGGGPELDRLKAQAADAAVPVHIVEDPSTPLLYALYQAAAVFVFPAVEDFGIMPVEAMTLGTPVVGSSFGGSAETITEGVSGIHFETTEAPDMARAIHKALELSPDDCRQASRTFSRERFDEEFRTWVTDKVRATITAGR